MLTHCSSDNIATREHNTHLVSGYLTTVLFIDQAQAGGLDRMKMSEQQVKNFMEGGRGVLHALAIWELSSSDNSGVRF
jgi:hypothetical protein